MGLLSEMVEQKHYRFAESAPDWEEAIRMSCASLEADGTVEESYRELIIACVKKYGPYIVIMPDVAMPHSQENAVGVHKTAIGFMKLEKPVSFEEGNPEKDARLFFTLASCNSEQHLQNMSRLSELLMNQDAVDAMLKATKPEDLIAIEKTIQAN